MKTSVLFINGLYCVGWLASSDERKKLRNKTQKLTTEKKFCFKNEMSEITMLKYVVLINKPLTKNVLELSLKLPS
jgi:hypothetical protein